MALQQVASAVRRVEPPGWLGGLDGLRAISIVLVVCAHAAATRGAPRWEWFPLTRATGVCLFFLISGFLITHLLLDEKRRFGGISLPRFYARRALRILPASYAMMVVFVVLRSAGFLHFSNLGLLASATYWRNYFRGAQAGDWVLDHTWSLSVEEQFYLVWPLLVRVAGARAAMRVALAGALGWPLLRLLRHGGLVQGAGSAALDVAGMDTILWGCLLALGLSQPELRARVARVARVPGGGALAGASLLALYAVADHVPPSLAVLLPLGRNLLMLWLLVAALRRTIDGDGDVRVHGGRGAVAGMRAGGHERRDGRRLFDRLLDARPMVMLGRASYSLYLWQQLFLQPDHPSPWCAFPLNVIGAVGAAALSFHVIERPCNRLRGRFSPVVTSAAPHHAASASAL